MPLPTPRRLSVPVTLVPVVIRALVWFIRDSHVAAHSSPGPIIPRGAAGGMVLWAWLHLSTEVPIRLYRMRARLEQAPCSAAGPGQCQDGNCSCFACRVLVVVFMNGLWLRSGTIQGGWWDVRRCTAVWLLVDCSHVVLLVCFTPHCRLRRFQVPPPVLVSCTNHVSLFETYTDIPVKQRLQGLVACWRGRCTLLLIPVGLGIFSTLDDIQLTDLRARFEQGALGASLVVVTFAVRGRWFSWG